MKESIWVELPSPERARDILTELLRKGAQQLLQQAVETELAAHLEAHADRRLETGCQRVVRHGHGPERGILTGIGSLRFRRPKARDRGATEGDRIRFTSAILPRQFSGWGLARRTKSLDAVLPTLYLRGVSTGDFGEALSAPVGSDARRRTGVSCRRAGRRRGPLDLGQLIAGPPPGELVESGGSSPGGAPARESGVPIRRSGARS